MKFKRDYNFQKRMEEANRVINKFPDRVPIICEKSRNASNDCPDIDKCKYLVPKDLTMGQFLCVIRNRLKLGPEKGVFLFVGNTIPPSAAYVNEIYSHYAENDGFLYVTYCLENVFG
jgi:GABA(A) receptor-associated protein